MVQTSTRDELIASVAGVPPISTFTCSEQVRYCMEQLYDVVASDVAGDIVELGCCIGTMSLFIQRLLVQMGTSRQYHAYDSFEGLPKLDVKDIPGSAQAATFSEGKFAVGVDRIIRHFADANLLPPILHKGWFGKISDVEYPHQIAFAYFDGDLYSSIVDSFARVYPRMAVGSVILIHDYSAPELPGVKKACDEFCAGSGQVLLVDRPICTIVKR